MLEVYFYGLFPDPKEAKADQENKDGNKAQQKEDSVALSEKTKRMSIK